MQAGERTQWLGLAHTKNTQIKASCQDHMFPAIVALVVFECLEWTESVVTARLSWTTPTLLEPILLDRLETLVRRATGVRGHRYALVSLQFPGFNIVRLWRLTAGYLKEILEDLGRRPERHHVFCFFQAQTFEDSVLWEPRGTEVFAENRRRELRRSPLRPYADLIHAWGLRLFVVRSPGGLCGAPSSAGEISVQIFSKKYCFSKFSFSGQSFHQKQTLGSIPGDAPAEFQAIRSFIHACLVSSSSNFSDRLCHIHACITVNSPSDQVILTK